MGFNYDNGTTNADYYYGIDNFGNINYIYDSTGAVVVTYRYDAWGKPISTTGSLASTIGTINPYRYKSYYYDTETGLYYLQSRYYDAGVGRFVNADEAMYLSTTDKLYANNLFVYCDNDSVNDSDPTGKWSWKGAFYTGIAIAAVGLALLASIPTGGGSLVLAGVGISAATAATVATSTTVVGIGIASVSVSFMAADGTPKNNRAQNKSFNDAMKYLKITNKRNIRRVHDAISGKNYTYWQIIEVAKKLFNLP